MRLPLQARAISTWLSLALAVAWAVAGLHGAYGQAAQAVRAGSEPDYPPYCVVAADGRAEGFSVELLAAALHAVGREVTFSTAPWSQLKADLAEGRLDALPLVGRTPEREAVYDFTFPYLTMHGTIVVRADNTDIQGKADLAGRRVAVLHGDNAEEYLRRAVPAATVVPVDSFEIALRELSAGQHDAVVIQKLLALQLMAQARLTNLKTVSPPLADFTQSFCFAVRKGQADLLATLNEGLSLVMADGTFRSLREKWFAPLEQATRARTKVVVGGDHNYPPYEFLDHHGNPAGLNVDLTRAIARRMGLAVEIRLGPWSDIREGLARGEVEVVQGMFYSSEREGSFAFSAAHSVIHHSIVTHTDTPAATELGELGGRVVAVMAGDIMDDLTRHLPASTRVVRAASQEEALRWVVERKCDAALVAKIPALYWIQQHRWTTLRVANESVLSPEYCYAVPAAAAGTLSAFAEGLAALKATGEYRTIMTKWLGPYAAPTLRDTLMGLAVYVVPLAAIIIGLFLWSYSLRRRVAARTRELVVEIDERHKVEQELRLSHDRFAHLVRLVPGMIFQYQEATDGTRSFPFVSPAAAALFEVDPENLVADPSIILHRVHRSDLRRLLAARAESRRTLTTVECEFRVVLPRAGLRWQSCQAHPERTAEGGVVWHGIVSDITARRQAEETMRLREAALEAAANAIVITDRTGTILWANRASRAFCGWTLPQALGRNSRELLPPGGLEQRRDDDIRQVTGRGEVWHGEVTTRRPDGSACTEDMTITPLLDPDGAPTHLVEIRQDITEKKAMEHHLIQSQRREAIGTLASGVAHDLNNILSPVLMISSMLRAGGFDPQTLELLRIVEQNADRGAHIVKQLLAFSRAREGSKISVQPRHFLNELSALMRETFPREINLVHDYDADLWTIVADPTQLHQVVLNLCLNARDAMPDGGTLRVACHNVDYDENSVPTGERPGRYVVISVSDTGQGIAPESKDRIFDPYYTTKPLGKGTGLGLSTVLGIVKGHDGWVTMHSEPGKGALFTVAFPAQDSGPGIALPVADQMRPVPAAPAPCTVLLVDDEPAILTATRVLLTQHGMKVITASDGADGFEKFVRHRGEIDLVLTDLMMPVVNGATMIRNIRQLAPYQQVIVTSGLMEVAPAATMVELRVAAVLSKPCEPAVLLKTIAQVLAVNK